MGCKEMMVSAPLIVLLFERTFISGSFADALRKSWRLYAGLLVSWIVIIGLSLRAPYAKNTGFHVGIAAQTWWFTQASVFLRYLKLAIWPWPLSIRYETTLLTFSQAWPAVLLAGLLGIGTLVLLWKNNSLGFLGAWLWFIISPTLVVPMPTEVTAERRMYLPLAALATLVVVGGYALVRKIRWIRWPITAGAAAVILCLSLVSAKRLSLYRDPVALWQQTVELQPSDDLSHTNLGYELYRKHRVDEAIAQFQITLRLNPHMAQAQNDLGIALVSMRRFPEAIVQFRNSVQSDPAFAEGYNNWGNALQESGDIPQAIQRYHQALALNPNYFKAHNNLGVALSLIGQMPEAMREYQLAVQLDPDYLEAYVNLVLGYVQMQEPQQATATAQKALVLARSQGETALANQIQNWLSKHGDGAMH
jgi:tetratricopeptide (TPR) repeat protein